MAHISLSIALSHVIAFLTKPLAAIISQEHIARVRICLEVNLTKDFEKVWFPEEPQRASGSRCLSLSPSRLPPRPLLTACHAARLRWSDWIAVLGAEEMDVFVDPGCVSVRRARGLATIWASSPTPAPTRARMTVPEDDGAELFSAIDRAVRPAPTTTWMAPLLQQFPPVPLRIDTRPSSRASSRASSSDDSCPSLVDADSASTRSASSVRSLYVPPARRGLSPLSAHSAAVYTASSPSSDDESGPRALGIRARVHVDATRSGPTMYDGGKTAVLTGGTMLGMPALKRNTRLA